MGRPFYFEFFIVLLGLLQVTANMTPVSQHKMWLTKCVLYSASGIHLGVSAVVHNIFF